MALATIGVATKDMMAVVLQLSARKRILDIEDGLSHAQPMPKAVRAGQAKESHMNSNAWQVRPATEGARGWAFEGGRR